MIVNNTSNVSFIHPATSTPKTNSVSSGVNFANITPNEFNELYKSGRFSELPPIALPAAGLDLTTDTKKQMDTSLDTKMNYVDMVQKQIAFNQSIGASTKHLVGLLSEMSDFTS